MTVVRDCDDSGDKICEIVWILSLQNGKIGEQVEEEGPKSE